MNKMAMWPALPPLRTTGLVFQGSWTLQWPSENLESYKSWHLGTNYILKSLLIPRNKRNISFQSNVITRASVSDQVFLPCYCFTNFLTSSYFNYVGQLIPSAPALCLHILHILWAPLRGRWRPGDKDGAMLSKNSRFPYQKVNFSKTLKIAHVNVCQAQLTADRVCLHCLAACGLRCFLLKLTIHDFLPGWQ